MITEMDFEKKKINFTTKYCEKKQSKLPNTCQHSSQVKWILSQHSLPII